MARGPGSGRVAACSFAEDGADLVRRCLGFVCGGTGFAFGFGSAKMGSVGASAGCLDREGAFGKSLRAGFRVKGVADVDDGGVDVEVVEAVDSDDSGEGFDDGFDENLEEDADGGVVGELARSFASASSSRGERLDEEPWLCCLVELFTITGAVVSEGMMMGCPECCCLEASGGEAMSQRGASESTVVCSVMIPGGPKKKKRAKRKGRRKPTEKVSKNKSDG